MTSKEIWVKVQNHDSREKMVLALVESGCTVRMEVTEDSTYNKTYFIVFVKPE